MPDAVLFHPTPVQLANWLALSGVVQPSLNVNLSLKGGKVESLKISGRPDWSNKVKKKHTINADEGEVRGHIIEWRLQMRYFEEKFRGMSVSKLRETIKADGDSPKSLERGLVQYLKDQYNEVDNITITKGEKDHLAGGEANKLAQQIEKGELEGKEREKALKTLYKSEFNPGKLPADSDKLRRYHEIFEAVYKVSLETLEGWGEEFGFVESAVEEDDLLEEDVHEEEKPLITQIPQEESRVGKGSVDRGKKRASQEEVSESSLLKKKRIRLKKRKMLKMGKRHLMFMPLHMRLAFSSSGLKVRRKKKRQ